MSSVKSNLRSRYENCMDTERTDSGHLSRSLIKCVVWTALQRGAYKVEWPKQFINEDLDTILLTDDDLMTDYSDKYEDSDEQMLHSNINSDISGSDDMLSHCSDDIELDSGYSSLSSPEKVFPGCIDPDSLYGELHEDTTNAESAIDNDESDLIAWRGREGGDIIRSSPFPPAVSDIRVENDVTSDPLGSSEHEAFDEDDTDGCEYQYDGDIMDNSSVISILSSSSGRTNTYRQIRKEIRGQLGTSCNGR